MTGLDLKDAIDRLDTGLPDHPDGERLTAIMSAGRRRRRRTHAAWIGAGLATAAAVIPVAVLVGGGAQQSAPDPDPADAPSSLVDPAATGHGAEMSAAVAESFPDAVLANEVLLDSWGDDDQGMPTAGASDPVRWETLFRWAQEYDVPGLEKFTVSSDRLAPQDRTGLDPVCVNASPRQHGCTETRVGDRVVIVEDGLPAGGQWIRVVLVVSDGSAPGLRSSVTVAATVAAATWAEAKPQLPSVDVLTDLALDDRLVLPEPASYPAR